MRLWLPELFTMVSENESSSDLCSMISASVNKSALSLEAMEDNKPCEDVVKADDLKYNTTTFTLTNRTSKVLYLKIG